MVHAIFENPGNGLSNEKNSDIFRMNQAFLQKQTQILRNMWKEYQKI